MLVGRKETKVNVPTLQLEDMRLGRHKRTHSRIIVNRGER